MSDNAKVRATISAANRMGRGAAQVDMMESAVRMADATRDIDLMFEARLQLIEAATQGGRGEKLLAAFTWCLTKWEQDPERHASKQWLMMWHFKNVVHAAIQFPSISVAEVDGVLLQMKEHYEQGGYSLRPMNYLKFIYKIETGELEEAAQLLPVWRKQHRDELSDCTACEDNNLTDFHIARGEWKKSLHAARLIINGEQSCANVPHTTYACLLMPLTRLGREEQADELQTKGYRLIRRNIGFLRHVGLHIAHLQRQGAERKAVNMLERHLSWALQTYEMLSRHVFLAAARNLLRQLAAKANRKRAFKLPRNFPLYDASDRYHPAELLGWFEAEVKSGGEALDARNQNNFTTTTLIDYLEY